jgi:multidrug efflux pump subunit AcrA (membrane-fusion protein)
MLEPSVAKGRLTPGQTHIPVTAMAADDRTRLDEGTIDLVDNQVDQSTGTISGGQREDHRDRPQLRDHHDRRVVGCVHEVALVDGEIMQVVFQEGQNVKTGDPLAIIEAEGQFPQPRAASLAGQFCQRPYRRG